MGIFKHRILFGGFKHFKAIFGLGVMNFPMPGTLRWIFARYAGVKFMVNSNDKPWFYIGKNVSFDTVYPENITIHNGVHITANCTLLTHGLNTDNTDNSDVFWIESHITIKERAFIGTGTIICADVIIGEGAIVGAGSVVTKNIPDYEIWAGNPAKFIKRR